MQDLHFAVLRSREATVVNSLLCLQEIEILVPATENYLNPSK
jgi:hypothetical protein